MSTRAIIVTLKDTTEVGCISHDGYPDNAGNPNCSLINKTPMAETPYNSLSYVYIYYKGEYTTFKRV